MNRTIILTAAILSLTSAAQAESINISADIAFESRYVFRGVELQEASVQPAVTISYGDLYGGVWFALPIGDNNGPPLQPFSDELDLFIGYNPTVSDFISVDVGVTYYTYPDTASGLFDSSTNTWEVFGGASFNAPLSPAAYVYHDFTLDTTTIEGALSYSLPIIDKMSFGIGGAFGHVFAGNGGQDYLYGTTNADLSYAFSDNGALYLGVRYGGADLPGGSIIDNSALGTFDSSGFWWGLGFNATF